jgi:hypothetical protein
VPGFKPDTFPIYMIAATTTEVTLIELDESVVDF